MSAKTDKILDKASRSRFFSLQAAFIINVGIAQDKMNEPQEAQRRCEEMRNNHLSIDQQTTLTYPLEKIDDRLPYSWVLRSFFVGSMESIVRYLPLMFRKTFGMILAKTLHMMYSQYFSHFFFNRPPLFFLPTTNIAIFQIRAHQRIDNSKVI